MPLSRRAARFQRRVTNRATGRVAGRAPGYGIVEHVGRRSGRTYRVPLNVFAVDGGFAIVVAYGTDSDWVRNLQAAGGGGLVHRRRRYRLCAPRLVAAAEAYPTLPVYGRVLCRAMRARHVLVVTALPD